MVLPIVTVGLSMALLFIFYLAALEPPAPSKVLGVSDCTKSLQLVGLACLLFDSVFSRA